MQPLATLVEKAKAILAKVDDFAKANKLKWGLDKCKMMTIGKKTKILEEWQLGNQVIGNASSYKYLGDEITSDGKNEKNILSRENKTNALVRKINTTASSDVMYGIESKVILNLYDVYVIPSLLNNAESWFLTIKEEKQLDTIGIRVIKRLFNLPTTSPNVSIVYSFGLLYITQVIDKKQFIYLHKLLTRIEPHWTHRYLKYQKTHNIAWAKQITNKLTEYDLETNWDMIRRMTPNEWKEKVRVAILKKNGQKLIENCTSLNGQDVKIHKKTKHIYEKLTNDRYKGTPIDALVQANKQRTRTVFLAQNGMLECGRNMKGTILETCSECNETDDEQHRLTTCKKWSNLNSNHDTSIHFHDIYSEDAERLNRITCT